MAGIEVKLKLYSPDRKQVQEMRVTTNERGYWGTILQGFEGEWDLNLQTYQEDKPVVARLRLERASIPDVTAYETGCLHLQHRLDSAVYAPWVKEEKQRDLTDKSIVLDQVEVEGRRRYIDYCTFQAFNVTKDAELMTDKGEYTYTVADYLMDKGYKLTHPKGNSFDLYYEAFRGKDSVGAEGNDNQGSSANQREILLEKDTSDVNALYLAWLMRQAPINEHRTLWFIKHGNQDRTTPSSLPGYEIDIEQVKSIIVYDTPHSYMGNLDIIELFDHRHFDYVGQPYHGFPAGLYVVEVYLNPNHNTLKS